MATFDLTTLKTITLLYIEDEQIVREQSLKIYKKLFKNVLWAEDGNKAYNIFIKNIKDIDIIVTDINIPNLSGLNLAKKIVDIHKVPIIITSAFTDTQYMIDAIDIGIKKYAVKPIAINNIIQDIEKLVTQNRAESNIKTITKDLIIKSKSTSQELESLNKENIFLKKSLKISEHLNDNYIMTIQTNKNGQILKASTRLCLFLSYNLDELLNKNISILKDISCKEKPFQKQMLEAIHKKVQIQSQHILKSKNNKIYKFDISMILFYGNNSLVDGYNFYLNLVSD